MSIILNQGGDKGSINIETAKGNPIDNYQVYNFSAFEKNQFQEYTVENYPSATFRNNATPIYDCHGMTFASRRTNIDNSKVIRKILSDDEYEEISKDSLIPGDIVLYVNTEDGDIIHSGRVIGCKKQENDLLYVKVVSKWGKYKEVVHNLYDCPYKNCSHKFLRVNYADE